MVLAGANRPHVSALPAVAVVVAAKVTCRPSSTLENGSEGCAEVAEWIVLEQGEKLRCGVNRFVAAEF